MKQAILDTSFILSCVKQKIDFFEDLELKGIKILIPNQVVDELEKLSEKNSIAKLSLKILKTRKFRKIDLKQKNVDNGIIDFAKENPEFLVATLDGVIKKKTKNSKIIIRVKKKIEII